MLVLVQQVYLLISMSKEAINRIKEIIKLSELGLTTSEMLKIRLIAKLFNAQWMKVWDIKEGDKRFT